MPVKKAPKNAYHVMTVRFLPHEWEHMQAVKAAQIKRERGRKVSYNEIIVRSVLDLPSR